MAGQIHYDGQAYLGSASLQNQGNATLYIGLYTNNTQLAKDKKMIDLVEVTGGGYARKPLNEVDWVKAAGLTPSNGTLFSQPRQTWIFNSAVGMVYGYFITTSASGTGGTLISSEHFDVPANVNQADFEIRITPRHEFK